MNSIDLPSPPLRTLRLPRKRERGGPSVNQRAAFATRWTALHPTERWDAAARPAPASTPAVEHAPQNDPQLEEAWQKIYRARELFDVELMNLREQQEALQTR